MLGGFRHNWAVLLRQGDLRGFPRRLKKRFMQRFTITSHAKKRKPSPRPRRLKPRIFRGMECLEPRLTLDSTVVFNEIMYHPAEAQSVEWIELHNQMAVNMDVSGWRLDGGISFDFPEQTVIPGNGFLVIASDPQALIDSAAIPETSQVMGPFTRRLSNGGEELLLLNNIDSFVTRPQPNGQPATVLSGNAGRRVMDRVEFSDRAPWPVGPDGSGASLAKISPTRGSREAINWSSGPVGGTPGVDNRVAPNDSITVAFNEIQVQAGGLQIELFNYGDEPENLAGMRIFTADRPTAYTLPERMLLPGEFLSLSPATLGIAANNSAQVFLLAANSPQLVDAVRASNQLQARLPDGTGRWLNAHSMTIGSANQVDLYDEVVINEILYHAYPDRGTPDIPPQFESTPLVRLDSAWRYFKNLSGEGLPTDWSATTHSADGARWLEGTGPFGFSNRASSLPIPLQIDFGDLRNNDPLITTFYFETEFELTGDPDQAELQAQAYVDDGAVFYVNGVEVYRLNMPDGAIDAQTQAVRGIATPALSEPFSFAIPPQTLRSGINRLSVQVHQSAPSSPDMVFAMNLSALTPISEAIPGRPFTDNPEEWIELYNRSDTPVDLTGWELAGGVEFAFPTRTIIEPGAYLLVANDGPALAEKYPELATQIVGSFSRSLSNSGERLVLYDHRGNPADELTYYDRADWPSAADGNGSSLELRDPDADNSIAESWAASNEAGRSEWKTYTYRGVAQDDRLGNDIFHELVLGLLEEGELLLDDIRVTEDPDGTAIQFLQNGDFQQDQLGERPAAWRLIGTHGDHGHSIVTLDPDDPTNHVLRLVATGPTEDKHNQASTTYANNERLQIGTEYEISFRARWVSGSNQLNTRLYFNFLQATTLIDVPTHSGTPGARNSTAESNVGPVYSHLSHQPVVPEADQAVTVTVMARDPDGVAMVRLQYSVDETEYQTLEMLGDVRGVYSATIPPQAARSIVQFYVEGIDGQGAISRFPASGPESRALYVVQDGQARLERSHNLRIIMTTSDTNFMYRNINRMSNDRLGATVVYNESEVVYDVQVRMKGSAFGRNNDVVAGLNLQFPPDQKFRGVHDTVSIERAQNRKEIVAKHMLNRAAGGLATYYDDAIHLIAPRRRDTGPAVLSMARTNDIYLDSLHEDGAGTPLYNLELLYSPTGTVGGDPEAPKLNFPYTHDRGRPQFEDLGDDKETYRWNFQLRNARAQDNYAPLIAMSKAFSLTGQELEDRVAELIDVDQWMRTFAMLSLNGNDDVYTRFWEHNLQVYVRPEDGKMLVVPWDLDRAFQLDVNDTSWGLTNNVGVRNNVAKIIERPIYERLFWGHVLDIANTTANREYMEQWTTHYGQIARQNFRPELDYIVRRADVLLGRLPTMVPFEITTGAGADFSTSERSVTLEGRGWVNVRSIRHADTDTPLNVTWLDGETFSVPIALNDGENIIRLEAVDHQGQVVGTDTVRITRSELLGDLNQDGSVNDQDVDRLAQAIAVNDLRFDLTGDGRVDIADHEHLIENILNSVAGDSNLDGVFNSTDLILAFGSGGYESGRIGEARWRSGDWNGDRQFNSRDLVYVFQKGTYIAAAPSQLQAQATSPRATDLVLALSTSRRTTSAPYRVIRT
jgi:hypothetical protein